MRQEEQIMEEAFAQLELHTGIHAEWKYQPAEIDGEADLFIEGGQFHVYIEVKREVRQYQLEQLLDQARQYQPFMIIAERIFPTIKESLRAEKIAYLDTAGNIFVNADGTYVWIDGRKTPKKAKMITNRAFTKAGLKTVFCLLANPNAINMPYRQLAQNANVALGNIQNVLDGLKDSGFILQKNKQEKLLRNKKQLLRRWIDGYRETLKPALHIGNYKFWDKDKINKWRQLPFPEHANAVWGGEGAAEEMTGYLNPAELTLYAENKSALVSVWTLIPDINGTVHIYEKFWQDNGQSGERLAPPVLVYADLILTDDPRCIETAEIIYNKYLKDEFEND
jgi:hypothetical protein